MHLAPDPRAFGQMPHVLLLDALGTLVALEPPAPALRRELAERFGIEVTHEQAAHAIAAEIAYYRAHLDEGRDAAGLTELRGRCAEVLSAALPHSAGLERIGTRAMTGALLASLRFSAFADAAPAIADARAGGCRVVVASNWDISLHDVLGRLGLAAMLDGIVTSAEVGARKPEPAVFERALALVDALPSDALHVGDSIEEDVRGARGAGIQPILIVRGERTPSADAVPGDVRVISSLSELRLGRNLHRSDAEHPTA
jgi:putative hydrolase of the HAD superfamily